MPRLTAPVSGLLVIVFAYHLVESGAVRQLQTKRGEQCHQATWEYKQSALESAWLKQVHMWNADTTEDEYCEFKKQYDKQVDSWLDGNAKLMASQRTHLSSFEPDVFSSFVTTYMCRGGESETFVSWIEPLAFSLRSPRAHCGSGAQELINRTYMLTASGHEHLPRHTNRFSVGGSNKLGRRAYLFDLGASLWSMGGGGPSQSWLITAYGVRGIHFDRILMWEAGPHTSSAIFKEVPRGLHAVYQYMNIPASADINDPGNPLNILKSITSPEDFVVLKLDIDHFQLENQFVKQLLDDPEVNSRVDEFYYENHVMWHPMRGNWQGTMDINKTLADSYDLFLKLRYLGIRSHGWP